jgi:hypothetical protein
MPYEWSTIAIIAVFGWPAVVVALVTFLVAVRLRQPALAILATVVSAPFCLFVSGYPLVGWWGVVVLFSNLLGALAVRRGLGGYASYCGCRL